MKNCKRILNVFLAFATVFSLLITENVVYGAGENDETNRDEVAFPVEIFDVDADGLFFEYEVNSGMANFGRTSEDGSIVTTGLVKPELGEDGNPVYTQEAIEDAAEQIYKILNGGLKENEELKKYTIFRGFAEKTISKGSTYNDCLNVLKMIMTR